VKFNGQRETTMKYLCLGYHEEKKWAAMPSSQRSALIDETRQYENELRQNGHFLDGKSLETADNAATLRFENGRMLVTDGPFTETKEQLGGVMVLEAVDLNHAIQLLSRMPCMRPGGSLEIRAINENVAP
jgi:hypothetical protein